MTELSDLYDARDEAYHAYLQEGRGEDHSVPGEVRYHVVRPKRLREKQAAWEAAIKAVKDAGYGQADVREMLQLRSAKGSKNGGRRAN